MAKAVLVPGKLFRLYREPAPGTLDYVALATTLSFTTRTDVQERALLGDQWKDQGPGQRSQRWLIEEARGLLLSLGARVFSPVHEVGPGPASVVAPEDIAGLEHADAVLAIANGLDPGTIFEIGYAVKLGIPVVVLAQNVKDEDLKMIEGTGCELTDDFASALYRVVGRLPAP